MRHLAIVASFNGRRRDQLRTLLESWDWDVLSAGDYHDAQEMLSYGSPDLVILDMLAVPGASPSLPEFHRWLRRHLQEYVTPVIYLVTRGFHWQGMKPVGPVLRKPIVEHVLRLTLTAVTTPRAPDGTVLDMSRCRFVFPGGAVHLTESEAKILAVLSHNVGRVVDYGTLSTDALGYAVSVDVSQLIRAHMSNLRQKLRAGGAEDIIETFRGKGYALVAPIPVLT